LLKTLDLEGPIDGILAILVSTSAPPSERLAREYRRLYGMLDWYSEKGELVTMHSDQVFWDNEKRRRTELTEIVFRESQQEENCLVVLNGLRSQVAKSINLEIKNHKGAIKQAAYPHEMDPFTLHKLSLKDLVTVHGSNMRKTQGKPPLGLTKQHC
jgi:hypothetical protein